MSKKRRSPIATRDILSLLFGSPVRARLLMLLSTTDQAYTLAELAKRVKATSRIINHEVTDLVRVGLIHLVRSKAAKTHITLIEFDRQHFLASELRALLLRAQLATSTKFAATIANAGHLIYFALLGHFTGTATPVDVLAVGRIHRGAFEKLITVFERDLGRAINYVVLTPEEFEERRALPDRFLMGILESRKIVLVDKLGLNV